MTSHHPFWPRVNTWLPTLSKGCWLVLIQGNGPTVFEWPIPLWPKGHPSEPLLLRIKCLQCPQKAFAGTHSNFLQGWDFQTFQKRNMKLPRGEENPELLQVKKAGKLSSHDMHLQHRQPRWRHCAQVGWFQRPA